MLARNGLTFGRCGGEKKVKCTRQAESYIREAVEMYEADG